MASYGAIKHECDQLNKVRNVEKVGSYSMQEFWSQAKGNFYISGGDADEREEILIDQLEDALLERNMPTVILTGSVSMERAVIDLIQGMNGTKLYVSSKRYPNYHVFHGMSCNTITNYLWDVITNKNTGIDIKLKSYIRAFLTVLGKRYILSLPAIRKMIELEDYQIVSLGVSEGVEKTTLDILTTGADYGVTFRTLIQELCDVFGIISTEECETEHSILNDATEKNRVLLINTRSKNSYIVNRYFYYELNELLEERNFRLILSDVSLQKDDGIEELINEMQLLQCNQLGISTYSLPVMFQREETRKGFPIQVILKGTGSVTGNDLELYHNLGDYKHYEASKGGSTDTEMITLFPSSNWQKGYQIRDRVRLEDTEGSQAVLTGHNGNQILIVKKIV